ncbi:MAG TPA: NAD(P)-dependent oxidoreductase [Devosiaceae bacterium]|nr:NAD(P)-dependent oxidoreductase [Devosiaceae bacterium]
MRFLLTGGSSFTGSWFARELASAGHQVVAVFRGASKSYESIRGDRVRGLEGLVEPVWETEFGDPRFLDIAASQDFDALLHHAAEMTDYRSWDFDPLAATARNTRSVRKLLEVLAGRGCRKLILTGSVFEPYEGVGDPEQRAFNPYGLSKHLSFELFRLEAERLQLSLGKFVIPNPFGPLEEMRFTSYLAREWAAGRVASVGTPAYIRDNIHVSLLARAYRRLCENLPAGPGLTRARPSGYVESQAAFARRFAAEIGTRTGWSCRLEEAVQTAFPEPLFRTNIERAQQLDPDWSETAAWDQLSQYYSTTFAGECSS